MVEYDEYKSRGNQASGCPSREELTKRPGETCKRYAGTTAVLQVEIAGNGCEVLLDTGASRSFINPKTVELLGLKSDKLRTYVSGRRCELPVIRARAEGSRDNGAKEIRRMTPPEQACEILAKQVASMKAEEAAVLLRPPAKRYRALVRAGAKVPIDSIVQQAKAGMRSLTEPVRGLCYIMVLPGAGEVGAHRLRDERQGALCCALIGQGRSCVRKARLQAILQAPANIVTVGDEEETPWPTAKLDYSHFDKGIGSEEMREVPKEILDVLRAHRAVFPEALPERLPPKRPHDHHILLVPGKLHT
ncbi:hypothetical protein EPH_0001890 [Eimeria praecox]|uniref:Uncharacterized protein n=1 Tax=Eimeria praecox TaxID=51316 RepID=U6G418_9EIME|nr:hypothetical protein EPH_0001890 [Eimeria praecox]